MLKGGKITESSNYTHSQSRIVAVLAAASSNLRVI